MGYMILGLGAPREPVSISALEFDVLIEHFQLDPMPLVLKVPSPGRTDDERAALVDQAWAGLANLDVQRLEHQLGILRRAEREIDGRVWVGRSLRLLAAAIGDDAVLAVLDGDRLTLHDADATGLPRHALSVLPATPAGPGRSVTLRTADFEAAAREATGQAELATALRNRGVKDAVELADMIGDVIHRGQFGSAVRDRWSRRKRAARVISFFDTAEGRYLQVRRDDQEAWTTISPADPRRLLQHLTELHEEQR
jgi:hypothetical protein